MQGEFRMQSAAGRLAPIATRHWPLVPFQLETPKEERGSACKTMAYRLRYKRLGIVGTALACRDAAGVCLAEAMIAMAAGVVVLSATIQTLNHFQQKLWAQHDAIAHHQDLRLGMGVMEAELRVAGPGAPAIGTGLLKAEPQEIEFLANLAGSVTTLSSAVSPGQEKLPVKDGSDWPKGKRLLVCTEDRCAEGRLARDGRQHALSLTDPLGEAFPAGSSVSISNQVRFYVRKDQSGTTSLMRQVDGGASTLIGDVTRFRLVYLDQEGKLTRDPARVARVRVELSVGEDRRVLTKDIGLRAR